MSEKISRFGIAYNPQIEDAKELSKGIVRFLEDLGAEICTIAAIQDKQMRQQIKKKTFEALIVVGGDGTMLRASHICASAHMPIVGINLGTMGFLIELERDEWDQYLPKLLLGEYYIEERMLIQAEHFRSDASRGSWLVVNEVVVCRGQHVRPIQITTEVDGYPMASYVADGLIAATPTGSTAYALAAGGAILPPEMRNIITVPVAPHLSPDQAIILAEGVTITIRVRTKHQAVFSIDGHIPVVMNDGDYVKVGSSDLNSRYIRFHDPGFFYRNLNRFMEQNPSFA